MVAKIERAEAVAEPDVLDGIIVAADGVMVARGDLAVQGSATPNWWACKAHHQPRLGPGPLLITDTQMMESMIHSPQPAAEVFDVANAVLDGTDTVMLSAETAAGEYPLETVQAMERICPAVAEALKATGRMARPEPGSGWD